MPSVPVNTTRYGSSSRASRKDTRPAIDGYCPVSAIDQKKRTKGLLEHKLEYGEKTYLFASAENKQKFAQEPKKYVPLFSGNCLVSLIESKVSVAGKMQFAGLYKNRLMLFLSAKQKQKFHSDSKKYINEYVQMRKRLQK